MTVATTSNPMIDLEQTNQALAGLDAADIVRWAADKYGEHLAMTSSFGAESAVMLHLVTRIVPDIPVILIDTGYLFPETYQFVDALTKKLKLNLEVVQSEMSPARMEATYGRLWDADDKESYDLYDQIRKVQPLQRALADLQANAWLAGLRGHQTDFRAALRMVERQRGVTKVHPILGWTRRDVHLYLQQHGLPRHPLYERGYTSIGDVHSTAPTVPGQDERAGRFKGLKQECGIHLPQSTEENESRDSSGL